MPSVGRMVKESIMAQLWAQLAERPNFFVATVNRLPAAEADTFRKKLYTSQARLVIVKRRLGRRTIEQLKIPGLQELLDGSVGLVLPESDVLPAAKTLVEFVKAHQDFLAVRGGVVEGQVLDKSRVEQLASLPSKPVLLAQLVAVIESPLADVIFTIERIVGDVAWTIEQLAARPPDTQPTAKEGTPS